MTINRRFGAAIALLAAFSLTACGEKSGDDAAGTTTRLDAVDVPRGTISDELMPLDTRNESSVAITPPAATGDANEAAATPAETSTETPTGATDSESETEQ